MSKRTDRREAERLARRNAYLQSQNPETAAEQLIESTNAEATEPIHSETTPATSKPLDRHLLAPEHRHLSDATIAQHRELLEGYGAKRNATISEAQLAANQANAQLSTGPVTEAGKAASSKNALKHGLTGKTVLLPTDDASEYQHLLEVYNKRLAPATDEEQALVQSLLDSTWRIARIKNLETGILLKGQIELAKLYEDLPAPRRAQLIQVETYLKYEKSIRNLNVQEARLHRRMEKDQAELTRLQTLRKREESQALRESRSVVRQASPATPTYTAPPNGFEFSTDQTIPLVALDSNNESSLKSCQAAAR